jgi:hypothetical protein
MVIFSNLKKRIGLQSRQQSKTFEKLRNKQMWPPLTVHSLYTFNFPTRIISVTIIGLSTHNQSINCKKQLALLFNKLVFPGV